MRGHAKSQPEFLTLLSPESVVPSDHPLREIKRRVDAVLRKLSPLFDKMYAEEGRCSIPPERLLKARLLIALYSVRSETLFCEQLGYNLLFRWFLDMDLTEEVFVQSVFSKNQERLLRHEVAQKFFRAVYEWSRQQQWASDEHFTVDGTLIESAASLKSFVPKQGPPPPSDGDGSNPSVDFHGQQRGNATHQSTTDPEARLYRKGQGKEARLYFAAHALMENRHGLLADVRVTRATGVTETKVALQQLRQHHRRTRVKPATVGADKGYHNAEFVSGCRRRGLAPHVAEVAGREVSGLDRRTTRQASYAISQRKRKRVEEIFGWMKTVGGLRRSRYRGIARTQLWACFVGAAYNLVRMMRLALAPPGLAAAG
jgi:transposase/IS5 family transposase